MKQFFRFLILTFKIHPKFHIVGLLEAINDTLKLLFSIYAIKFIIDAVIDKDFNKALIVAAILVGIQLLLTFFTHLFGALKNTHSLALSLKINHYMTEKIMKFDYEKLEDPYYLDLKDKAKFANDNQGVIYRLLNSMLILTSKTITIISLLIVLMTYQVLLGLVFLALLGIFILIYWASTKSQLEFTNKLIPINRKFGYYLGNLMNPELAKDYRFTNMNKLLHQKTSGFINQTTQEIKKMLNDQYKYIFFNQMVNYLQMAFFFIYFTIKMLFYGLIISSFIMLITTAFNLTNNIAQVVSEFAEFRRSIFWLRPFSQLLDVKNKSDETNLLSIDSIDTIEFKNVSFKYPNTDILVLKDISFKINRGEKISIVGLNGAGKTTIVKLISKFYAATSGEILINGININLINDSSLIKHLSAIFQDFKVFSFSIVENIAGCYDLEKATVCAEKLDLQKVFDKLPNKIETNLSKSMYKDGVELSGGEIQKIAIARTLYKDSNVVILDEPTSALDPFAEANIYEHFNQLVESKTAIYISHRMSSSIFCDKILVLNEGVIEDFLPHKELMKKKESLYYKLFTTQSKNYQRN